MPGFVTHAFRPAPLTGYSDRYHSARRPPFPFRITTTENEFNVNGGHLLSLVVGTRSMEISILAHDKSLVCKTCICPLFSFLIMCKRKSTTSKCTHYRNCGRQANKYEVQYLSDNTYKQNRNSNEKNNKKSNHL